MQQNKNKMSYRRHLNEIIKDKFMNLYMDSSSTEVNKVDQGQLKCFIGRESHFFYIYKESYIISSTFPQ